MNKPETPLRDRSEGGAPGVGGAHGQGLAPREGVVLGAVKGRGVDGHRVLGGPRGRRFCRGPAGRRIMKCKALPCRLSSKMKLTDIMLKYASRILPSTGGEWLGGGGWAVAIAKPGNTEAGNKQFFSRK